MPRGERKDPVWTKLPVPGVVTARRDSAQTLRLRQKRQEEEEQLKKQRREAEEAARILARRWRREDRGEGRRREDGEEDEAGQEEPESSGGQRHFREVDLGRETVRTERGADPAGVWVVTEEVQRPRPQQPRSHRSDEPAERKPSAEVSAAFESPARPEKRRREDRRSPSMAAAAAAAPPAAPATSRPKAKSKTALAGVFGLDDSDDERESTARQMELAAAGRRQTFARRAGIAATRGAGSSSGSGREREPLPKPLDPAEVYMRCSQWKQSCNGKEMTMPEELRRALAEVTGNALGHGAPTPARRS